jgi:hypothetical protein
MNFQNTTMSHAKLFTTKGYSFHTLWHACMSPITVSVNKNTFHTRARWQNCWKQ